MKLVLHSITYHDCPVQVREQVSFSDEQQRLMLRRMHADENIGEAAILDTCNRVEFYLYAKKSFNTGGFLRDVIAEVRPQGVETWSEHSRQVTGIDVAHHLFEVAAGLDSQMLGENQVLSQVKSAYKMSLNCRTSRFMFHHLFHTAFRVGKAVRTHTDINCGAVSLSLAAVEVAREKVELPASGAMIIGAGENAELAAKYLIKAGLGKLIIANRSRDTAEQMSSRLRTGEVVGLDEVAVRLGDVDLLISSTGAERPVLTCEMTESVLATRDKPLLIIDIAVPRDIDDGVGDFECVSLYNIDDLDEQISRNIQKRSSEVPKAHAIVAGFTRQFGKWYQSLDLVPVISGLTQQAIELARSEARRYAKDFGDECGEKLELFAESLAKKLLHGPISFLKADDEDQVTAEQLQAADLINRMFLSQGKRDR